MSSHSQVEVSPHPPIRTDLDQESPHLAAVVHRNMAALVQFKKEHDAAKSIQDRAADAITGFAGSMRFVYFHLALVATWIIINIGVIPGIPAFDPYPFVMLAMFASVEAIFLSTFVLISQNRMAALADRRADLDLHVSLLAEHEVTRLIRMTEAIAERLNVSTPPADELHELEQDVQPEEVLQELEAVSLAAERHSLH
jgi:uncharacterized membrane protein